jgi:hypothetical protein
MFILYYNNNNYTIELMIGNNISEEESKNLKQILSTKLAKTTTWNSKLLQSLLNSKSSE